MRQQQHSQTNNFGLGGSKSSIGSNTNHLNRAESEKEQHNNNNDGLASKSFEDFDDSSVDSIWRTNPSSSLSSSTEAPAADHPLLGLHLQRRSKSDQLVSYHHSSSLPVPSSTSLAVVAEDREETHQQQQRDDDDDQKLLSSRVIGPSRSFGAFTYSRFTNSTGTGTVERSNSIATTAPPTSIDYSSKFALGNVFCTLASTDNPTSAGNEHDTDNKINTKMTPRSPTLQIDPRDESDEFAPVTSSEPLEADESDLTSHGGLADEVNRSSLSLGDVDASQISTTTSQGHTVVIPTAPVSRNLTDAFESTADDGNLAAAATAINTPSPSFKMGGGNCNNSDGESPAGVEQLDVEGMTVGSGTGSGSTGKDPATALKTPRAAAQAAPASSTAKVGPSPRIDVFGETIPFTLHPILALDLPAPTVNRVSFYSVIHDINKEASGMAANDPASVGGRPRASSDAGNSVAGSMSTISAASSGGEPPKDEEYSPLVMAVNGPPPGLPMRQTMSKISTATTAASSTESTSSAAASATIDEEKWLLRAVSSRPESEVQDVGSCPPTFAQAIGESESVIDDGSSGSVASSQAPNPIADLSQSRTQLWKPSRSWWEAKSGKNPWIEPSSHNKRWRYLWPLIHYHKFLAKCIKKLKRNGVDVKTSVSPVSAFLRAEVCAVSDHLARCSYFSSDEWMGALQFFDGWTDTSPEAEEAMRNLILNQDLRAHGEPADTDSPLLRDQIDGRFLKAMAAARSKQPASNGAPVQGKARSSPTEGKPPMVPGPGLPRPGGRPPVSAISTNKPEQQSSGRKARRGRRGRGSTKFSTSESDLSMSSKGSSMGEEGAAWNGGPIPPSSPYQPPPYPDPSMMQGGGYGHMPPPYGMYGHNPYYGHPPHGMAPPMMGQAPPGFYGQQPNPHWAGSPYGHPPPPGHPYPGQPQYPMQDPNASLDNSFYGMPPDGSGGMFMPPHPQVPGTPDQSMDKGPDMSMASPAWAHLDRLATGLIATPSTNRTGRAKQAAMNGGPKSNIKHAVAGAARSLVFGDNAAGGNGANSGVPPSPATMFASSKSPVPKAANTTPADTTTATVDVPEVHRASPSVDESSQAS